MPGNEPVYTVRISYQEYPVKTAKVFKHGNSQAARLKANQPVKLTVKNRCVIVSPRAPRPLTLAKPLERYDPAVHGGEAMAAPLTGAEKL